MTQVRSAPPHYERSVDRIIPLDDKVLVGLWRASTSRLVISCMELIRVEK
jgi:hypothetical protein